jgi:Uma2 family endonuclease
MGNAGRQHEWVKANINRQLAQLARALTGDPDKLFEGAPDLAIEVVSSETAEFLERKIALYLETGSQAVWVAYPKHRTLWTHHADGIARVLKEDQYLEEPGLLPGFRVLVSNFFEGL